MTHRAELILTLLLCAALVPMSATAQVDTEPRLKDFSDVLTFDVSPAVTLQSFSDFAGVWGNYPYFESGVIVVSDFFNGLFSVKLDLPE